ncbi:unnamed protein product [Zymoseptoria tritici ST99CH_3D1]|nr:unnamed protein product [Zymoseptoria tritici ST99CH_3D1]
MASPKRNHIFISPMSCTRSCIPGCDRTSNAAPAKVRPRGSSNSAKIIPSEFDCACKDGIHTKKLAMHEVYARTGDKHQAIPPPAEESQAITEHLVDMIRKRSQKSMYKVLGAGLSSELAALNPQLPLMRWARLDIFLMTLAARAAVTSAHSLETGNEKIAFFGATPQGGGVALKRHALLRYLDLVGVDCTRYVPTPEPEVFRLRRIRIGTASLISADLRFSGAKEKSVDDFAKTNVKRLWTGGGMPLAPRSNGGADTNIVNAHQTTARTSIAEDLDPTRPVICRAHIQIRTELIQDPTSATSPLWNWLWSHVKKADLFIAHPFAACIPHFVPKDKLAYFPATTDRPDGIKKNISDSDIQYHLEIFGAACFRERLSTPTYPKRDYIVQIARFDPAKDINNALDAYAEFRRNSAFCHRKPTSGTPQLVLRGHASVHDPDGSTVFNEALDRLKRYPELRDSVIIVRLGPGDQLPNCLLSRARVALQYGTMSTQHNVSDHNVPTRYNVAPGTAYGACSTRGKKILEVFMVVGWIFLAVGGRLPNPLARLIVSGIGTVVSVVCDGLMSDCIPWYVWTTWVRVVGQLAVAIVGILWDSWAYLEERRIQAKIDRLEELNSTVVVGRTGWTTSSTNIALSDMPVGLRRRDPSGSASTEVTDQGEV